MKAIQILIFFIVGAIKRFNGMKAEHPDIKTMVAIGGWNEGSETFSTVSI